MWHSYHPAFKICKNFYPRLTPCEKIVMFSCPSTQKLFYAKRRLLMMQLEHCIYMLCLHHRKITPPAKSALNTRSLHPIFKGKTPILRKNPRNVTAQLHKLHVVEISHAAAVKDYPESSVETF
jgi:hypothetical protein